MSGWPMARAKAEKPYHHGELREALVAAGRKLLEEKGLRSFTLRECARRAQVSHAAPAHHFASIDDLLAEIATRGYHDLTAAMTAEGRRSGGDAAAGCCGQVRLPPAPRRRRSGHPAGLGRREGTHGRLRLGRRAWLHHPGPGRPARRAGFPAGAQGAWA